MNQPPTQEQRDEAFLGSQGRDPTPECWGMYVYSDAPPNVCGSGLGSFHWFSTVDDLLSFIREYMAWWHPAPSSMEPEEVAEEVQSIVDRWDPQVSGISELQDQLNAAMKNMWHIQWWGEFSELTDGVGEFPEQIRNDFLEDDEVDAQDVGPLPAIATDELDEFKDYLRMYGI
jgi:hypothetical protein